MVIPHGMWDLISQPGIELMPLYWKGRILITGPQGKSLDYLDSLIYLIIQLLSHVWLFVTPWTIAYQDSPSMEFSRQEYWSGLPFPSPEYLVKPVNPTGNQSWIFIGRTAEAEAPIFGHLIWRVDSLEKILTLGKTEVRRRRVWQRMMVEDWSQQEESVTEDNGWMASLDMSLSKLWEMVKDRKVWRAELHGVAKSGTWLSKWTTAISSLPKLPRFLICKDSNLKFLARWRREAGRGGERLTGESFPCELCCGGHLQKTSQQFFIGTL